MSDQTQLPAADFNLPPGVRAADIPGNAMPSDPVERFDYQIEDHRREAMKHIETIRQRAERYLNTDAQINEALAVIHVQLGCARSRMAQLRAWKEARSLFAHLINPGRSAGTTAV